MKFSRGVFQFFILVCVCVGAQRYIRKLYTVPTPKKFVLHSANACFSKNMHEHLNLFAKEHEKLSFTVADFSEMLRNTFPAITSIALKSDVSGIVQATFKGARPLAIVNKDFVLGTNNKLLERTVFLETDIKDLPQFYVAQTKKDKEEHYISDACVSFIRKFNPLLLNRYDVQWVNETLILLRDQKNNRVTMLIDDQTEITEKITLAYEEVKQKTVEKDTRSKGRDWFVDMRFRNQVIVFPKGASV